MRGLSVLGPAASPGAVETCRFLEANGVGARWVDIENDPLVRFLLGDRGVEAHDRDPLFLESSEAGVVAGNVRHGSIERVASAVGESARATAPAQRFLAG